MLATALIGFVILLCCLPLGYFFFQITNTTKDEFRLVDFVFAGLSLIIAIAALLSFFMAIDALAFIAVLLLAAIFWLRYIVGLKQIIIDAFESMRGHQVVCLLAVITAIMILGTEVPTWVDAGLYHAQSINWLSEYGLVPGLGNLHLRLAFNSHFHLLAATFDFSFLKISHFHGVAVVFLMVVFCLHYLFEAIKFSKTDSFRALYNLVVVAILLLVFDNWYSSPSSDLPVTLFTLVALELIFIRKSTHLIYVTLLVATAITIKLTAFPLSVLLIALLVKRFRTKQLTFTIVVHMLLTMLIILAPFLVRNVMLSGYLLVPHTQIDLFSLHWKVPKAEVQKHQQEIKYFARRPLADWQEVKEMSSIQWIPIWFNQQRQLDRLLIWVAFAALLLAMILRFARPAKTFAMEFLLFSLLALITLLAMAPALRFVYQFLIPVTAISLASLLARFGKLLVFAWTGIILILFLLVAKDFREGEIHLARQVILPAPYNQVAVKKYSVDGQIFFVPTENDKCWNAALPCLDKLPGEGLRLIGKELDEGFFIQH